MLLVACTLMLATASPVLAHPPEERPYDATRPVWQAGREVPVFIQFTTPPPDPNRTATVYLTAPVKADDPQDLGGVFPLPGGGTITIPVHDDTLPLKVVGYHRRAACFGYWVVAGPNAGDRVHTRTDPNGSGLVLAYEVDFGFGFIPLTSTFVIEAALRHGLLSRVELGPGGTCWTEPWRSVD